MNLSEFNPTYLHCNAGEHCIVAEFTCPSLTEDENIEQIGVELFTLLDKYLAENIVVDMRQVEYITSSVIGKLITLHRRLRRVDGRMILCELTTCVEEILRNSRLIDYFETASSLNDALGMLEHSPNAN